MSDAKLFAITGFGGGISIGIQADNFAEFDATCRQVFGDAAGQVFAREVFNTLRAHAPAAQATGVVDQTIGVTAVVPAQPVSTVGQPLPQPTVPAQPVAQPTVAAVPPNVTYPGNCAHGARVYVDKPARGKAWRRWECAIPWSKHAVGRCDPINVES